MDHDRAPEGTESSYSGNNPNRAECRAEGSAVLIRDTRHRDAGPLAISTRERTALLSALRTGEL